MSMNFASDLSVDVAKSGAIKISGNGNSQQSPMVTCSFPYPHELLYLIDGSDPFGFPIECVATIEGSVDDQGRQGFIVKDITVSAFTKQGGLAQIELPHPTAEDDSDKARMWRKIWADIQENAQDEVFYVMAEVLRDFQSAN